MLVREADGGPEVLVIRRHENLAFMGGMWVFPGGALSAADVSPESLARIPEASRALCPRFRDLKGDALDMQLCLGLTVAAYRETFEETGVLLATTANGGQCSGDVLERAQHQRLAVTSEPMRFAALLKDENLLLDVDRLLYWAHWVTPSTVPRRFDTRFFIASVPPEQTAVIDAVEAVEHAWMRPAALLDASRSGAMRVAQPTLYNLIEFDATLRDYGSLAAMLAGESQREVAPVLPKVINTDSTTIIMPWDAGYDAAAGEGAPANIAYPARLRSLQSRMTRKR
jgi:8-oxo-dGTP pyrophosphatase MutT (NUDIX family)